MINSFSTCEDEAWLKAAASEAERKRREKKLKKKLKSREKKLKHVGVEVFTKEDHASLEPDDWKHTEGRNNITSAEVALAKRCHGAHIELALASDITPAGSHYLLIHYDVPKIDPETHKLRLFGLVQNELLLSMSDIRARPSATRPVLMACAGTGRMALKNRLRLHVPWGPDSFGCAEWTGCSLADVLREAGLQDDTKQVIFTGADKGVEGHKVQYFRRSLSIDDAMLGHVMLVYQMNGADLLPCHGAPLRLIVPGWYGMASVKWLTSIEVTAGGWWGYQMEAYSWRRAANDPERVPLEQLPVRALMAPPGYPEFFSRTRLVGPGTVRIVGRAWAGAVDIDRVEFSTDYSRTWTTAVLGPKNGAFGWASWHYDWTAEEGTYILMCRAFDKRGRSQDEPSDEQFDWTAMGCAQPQMVYVKVDKSIETEGATIDLTLEQKAAIFPEDSTLSPEIIDALYRSPGSH